VLNTINQIKSIFILEGGNSLSYCGQPKTWIEAKTFCEVKGGRLMNRGTENDAVFLQRTDIPAYQEIWLGQYKGLSGWVEKIGKNFYDRSGGNFFLDLDRLKKANIDPRVIYDIVQNYLPKVEGIERMIYKEDIITSSATDKITHRLQNMIHPYKVP